VTALQQALRVYWWMQKISKRHVSRKRKTKRASINLFTAHGIGSGFHGETGCRKVFAGKLRCSATSKFNGGERTELAVEITPTASQLTKSGKIQSAECHLCSSLRVQEDRGESTHNMAFETYSHMNSAGCEGMATDNYDCPLLHLDAPVWQHACCTKDQKQA